MFLKENQDRKKGDMLSNIKSHDSFIMLSREITRQITKTVSPLPQILWQPYFQGPTFKIRGSQLASRITT